MKKVFLVMMLALGLAITQTSNAQITLNPATTSLDSILNAGTTYFKTGAVSVTSSGTLSNANTGNYRFVFTATNVSGTSTFKAVIEGSMDGTNWFGLTKVPGTDGNNCDTLQCTSVTTATQFTCTSLPGGGKYVYSANYFNTGGRCLYLRIRFIGTGTQVTRISAVKVYPFVL